MILKVIRKIKISYMQTEFYGKIPVKSKFKTILRKKKKSELPPLAKKSELPRL